MAAVVAIANALEVVGILQAADFSVRLSLFTDIKQHVPIKTMTFPSLSVHICRHTWPVGPSPAASSAGPSRP